MKYTEQQIKEAVKKSISYAGVLRILGIKQAGGSQTHIKKRIEMLGIDISHFKGQSHYSGLSKKKKEIEKVLCLGEQNSYREKAYILRRCMLESGIEYKCETCSIVEYNNKPITLQIYHINGVSYDNRLKNLRFLCPNCHSQTKTYGSKNKRV